MTTGGRDGALVISLDFELYWGVRDLLPGDGGAYRANLLAMREVIPRTLDLFASYDVAATWAVVGLLYSATAGEAQKRVPSILPGYVDPDLAPYAELRALAPDDADEIRFAPDLIQRIAAAKRQEIGTHTFSHYYCLEPGQSREAFRADLARAIEVAETAGVERPRSIVFPRNQFNADYADVLADLGFTCCRTNARGWFNREMAGDRYFRPEIRCGRLIDSYLPAAGSQVISWRDVDLVSGVCCLPASHFVRAYTPAVRRFEFLKVRRIRRDIERAARNGGIVHLWWHPENFGRYPDQSFDLLERILESFAEQRHRYGFTSLTMGEVGARARRSASAPSHSPALPSRRAVTRAVHSSRVSGLSRLDSDQDRRGPKAVGDG